jgi:hypothetical protein
MEPVANCEESDANGYVQRACVRYRLGAPAPIAIMSKSAPHLVVDDHQLQANSRLVSIRLVLMTLRFMENWRELVDDQEKVMILLAVAAITGERFTRGEGLEGDERDLRKSIPPERNQYGNMRSVAHAVGLNRETTRRKVHELIEAGILMRTEDGRLRFDPKARQVGQVMDLLRKQFDLVVRLTNEMLKDGIATLG